MKNFEHSAVKVNEAGKREADGWYFQYNGSYPDDFITDKRIAEEIKRGLAPDETCTEYFKHPAPSKPAGEPVAKAIVPGYVLEWLGPRFGCGLPRGEHYLYTHPTPEAVRKLVDACVTLLWQHDRKPEHDLRPCSWEPFRAALAEVRASMDAMEAKTETDHAMAEAVRKLVDVLGRISELEDADPRILAGIARKAIAEVRAEQAKEK